MLEFHVQLLGQPSSSPPSSESGAIRPRDWRDQMPILRALLHLEKPDASKCEMHDDKKILVEKPSRNCRCVHFPAAQDSYAYPQSGLGDIVSKQPLYVQAFSSKKTYPYGPLPLLDKKFAETIETRLKCRHCSEWYIEKENRAGACEDAPDCCETCINTVTCMKGAQCMLYHCMPESEGDYSLRPCACTSPPDERCTNRWTFVSLLSLFIPCLCLFPPLHCLHRAARKRNIVGGHHSPLNQVDKGLE